MVPLHSSSLTAALDIVHLRDYKASVYGTPSLDALGREVNAYTDYAWRYYLEYAPYGDLENLRARYRAFHRYLPELFLWHVFNSLAKAVHVLEKKQRAWPDAFKDGEYVVHADIKPKNIFLGYEELERPEETPLDSERLEEPIECEQPHFQSGGLQNPEDIPIYPSIKLGDFGLAMYTSEQDEANPEKFRGVGTAYFQPPVSIEGCRKGFALTANRSYHNEAQMGTSLCMGVLGIRQSMVQQRK